MSDTRLPWLTEWRRDSTECVVCGRDAGGQRYFRFPCCNPYDDAGRVVCRCKYTLSDLILRERDYRSALAETGAADAWEV